MDFFCVTALKQAIKILGAFDVTSRPDCRSNYVTADFKKIYMGDLSLHES